MSEEGDDAATMADTLESAAQTASNAVVSATDTVIGAFTTPAPAGPSGASIKVAKDPLKAAIKAALKTAKASAHGAGNGGAIDDNTGADPIIEALGEALGTAIHNYFTNAWVDITAVQSVAWPGVICETIGISPIRPVAAGAIIQPIITTHHALPGMGKLK